MESGDPAVGVDELVQQVAYSGVCLFSFLPYDDVYAHANGVSYA